MFGSTAVLPARASSAFSPAVPVAWPGMGVPVLAVCAAVPKTAALACCCARASSAGIAPGCGGRKEKSGGMLSGARVATANSSGPLLRPRPNSSLNWFIAFEQALKVKAARPTPAKNSVRDFRRVEWERQNWFIKSPIGEIQKPGYSPISGPLIYPIPAF